MVTDPDGCLTLKVSSLGNRVGGIALQDDGPVVFIRGALPGETVKVLVTSYGKKHLDAELVSVLSPCPERVEPFCPLHGVCGGCSLQHLAYTAQLFWKKKWIEKAFKGFSGFSQDDVIPSPLTGGFRNRVTFCVSGGKPCLHAFRGDPVPVQDCPALDSAGRAVLGEIWKTGVPPGVDSIAVRCSRSTGQTLVEVVGPVRGLPKSWGAVYERSMGLRGAQLTEKLLEWDFPIPPGGFFQVNTRAAELLLEKVLEHAAGETILDLYGGAGTFGIPLAARGARVDSVESGASAAASAGEAAGINGIRGFRSFAERDAAFLTRAVSRGQVFDTVILDPPRAGVGPGIMEMINRVAPHRVIYITCNPFTAARDTAVLAERGFHLKKAVPVDMFPHTDHVETLLLLERNPV
ncbi:MAG: RsmD family RNA methyltransferase [Candidatus Fermentibacteraceae bacterium]